MLIVSSILLSLHLTLLNADYLEQVLSRRQVFERMPEMVVDSLLEQIRTNSDDPDLATDFVATIGEENLEAFVEALLPADWVQDQVEGNVQSFFKWLEGEDDQLILEVGTQELQRNLHTSELRNAVGGLFDNLPACEIGEVFTFQEYPQCRPIQSELDVLLDDMTLGLEEMFEGITDEFQTEIDLGQIEALRSIRSVYQYLKYGSYLVWLITGALFGLVLLFAARSVEEGLRWLGWPFTLTGALGVGIVGIGLVIVALRFERWFGYLVSSQYEAPIFAILGSSILKVFILDVLQQWLIIAGGSLMLGIGGLILARLMQRMRGK
jgi:hypothetical protein